MASFLYIYFSLEIFCFPLFTFSKTGVFCVTLSSGGGGPQPWVLSYVVTLGLCLAFQRFPPAVHGPEIQQALLEAPASAPQQQHSEGHKAVRCSSPVGARR